MTGDASRYALVHAILAGAMHLRGTGLDGFLTSVCGDDEALRASVLELLAAGRDDGKDDMFADGNIDSVRAARDAAVDETSA